MVPNLTCHILACTLVLISIGVRGIVISKLCYWIDSFNFGLLFAEKLFDFLHSAWLISCDILIDLLGIFC